MSKDTNTRDNARDNLMVTVDLASGFVLGVLLTQWGFHYVGIGIAALLCASAIYRYRRVSRDADDS